jgi:dTDP-4-amino-4,6-dideoxy-D-galactose acyltransferase
LFYSISLVISAKTNIDDTLLAVNKGTAGKREKMNNTINILDWDSNFFNLRVCRINGTIKDNNELALVLQELKNLDIDLGYYSSPVPLTVPQNTGQPYDISLVDKKTTYLKPINENAVFSKSITPYTDSYAGDELLELAIQSGIYSRFNVDKKISTVKYEELYREWITNSVTKKLAIEVLVYWNNNKITGFVTLRDDNSTADIGIIAVDQRYRGKGIGTSLVQSAEKWFANNNYTYIQAITQGDNLPACRFYESCGYQINKVEYFYHLWKKDKDH